jgi:hypothetical protein
MELPGLLDALDARTTASLPSAVVHELEEVQNVGGKQHLLEILTEIGKQRETLDRDMHQVWSLMRLELLLRKGIKLVK